MLERAAGANDVVAVACVRDKLASLRPLADIAADRRGDAEISAMAAERATTILRQAEVCLGAEAALLEPSRAAEQGVQRGAGSAAR